MPRPAPVPAPRVSPASPPARRWLPAVLAVLAALVLALPALALPARALAAAPGPDGTAAAGPVVLVGTGGLRWSDVSADATPVLAGLAGEGAVGTVAVRSVFTAACPGDGWLGLSAGRRATDFDGTSAEHVRAACAPLSDPVPDPVTADGPADATADGAPAPAQQPDAERYRAIAAAGTFGASPGLLGDALRGGGASTLALGPGAAIALAGRDGSVPAYAGPTGPTADGWEPAELAERVREAVAGGTDLLVVDAGAVRDPADLPAEEEPPAASRAEQVAAVEARVAAVREALTAAGADPATGASTLLVASLADAGRTAHLQYAGAVGAAPVGGDLYDGLLESRSTRQTGIVQTTDLTPTLLALALGGDHGTPGLVGAPVGSTEAGTSAAERVEKVRDLDLAAQAVQPLVQPFYTGWVLSQVVLYAVATFALRRSWGGPRGRRRVLAWLRALAVVYGAVPASTFLANTLPWWRAEGSHLLAVTGACALHVALITALALLGPWRRSPLGPLGVVGAVTAGVLTVDVLTGSRLITSSLNGLQPVVAGRFYGLGNAQFALFATGTLLALVAVADALVRRGRRRAAVVVVAVVGAAAVWVNGVPGADFGGPPASVPAFGLLALYVAGVRITWRRVLLLLAGTVVVITSIALVDWLRPVDDQTHLGRFVQTVLDGGAWQVVERKALQNWRILVGSWLTLVLPFAAAFTAFVLARPGAVGVSALQRAYDRHPVLKPGMVCLGVLLVIGFAVNDSGTAIPAVGLMLALPLLTAACTQVLALAERPAPGAPEAATASASPAPRP
ncbi:hypothetical protein [Kineococcus sp. SYSU DK004]|uniref:hypothetical protein n=1 Tax=Kineococcus sp. SYSU DK004 TaxID=3383125 RepID=UPI003D7E7263